MKVEVNSEFTSCDQTQRQDLTNLSPLVVSGRIDLLRAKYQEAGIDGLIITALPNIRYLTGFTGSAGVLTVSTDRAVLTTDGRYRTQSLEQVDQAGGSGEIDVEIGSMSFQKDRARDLLDGCTRVGLEAEAVTWAEMIAWERLLEGKILVQTTDLVEDLRLVKTPGELQRMECAAAIADSALYEVLPMLSEVSSREVTEQEFALALDSAMRRRGAQGLAFDTIVASGPNSAKPHHQPTNRPMRHGESVVVDFGAMFDGYRSDMTRTFCLGGEPEGELALLFSVVQQAQKAGVEMIRSGVGAKDVDAACREIIAEAGWAEFFEHGTGHGVGIDIHEAPSVSPLGTAILSPGVVITVEPGVYLRDIGGVRVEDMLVVTENSSRSLTNFTKDVVA